MNYRVEKWTSEKPPVANELESAMLADGYGVYQWSDAPGTVYGRHQHGDEQSHCVVSGSLELDVEGYGTFILTPGDRDFMPAGTFHSARVIGDIPVVYLIGSK